MRQHTCVVQFLLASMIVALLSGSSVWAAEPASTRPAGLHAATFVPVPPQMHKDLPALRTRGEVSRVIRKAEPPRELRKLRVVLVAGPKDHGPGEHDYPAWQKAWHKLIGNAEKVNVTTAWEKPSADDFKSADVIVLFKHFAWPKDLNANVEAFLARGGGLVLLHFAVDGGDNGDFVGKCIGPYWGQGAKFRHGWVDLVFQKKSDQPFLRGLAGQTLRFHDETYWQLTGDPAKIEVLATGMEDDGDRKISIPLLWNKTVGKGRVHVNILGHYNWTFNDPLFRVLVLRGIAWAAGEPVERLDSLATVDVRLKEQQ